MKTKRLHLLPILSLLPVLLVLLLVTQFNWRPDPLFIAAVAIIYLALNVIFRVKHETFEVGYVVEYSLIALIVYFVLTQYI